MTDYVWIATEVVDGTVVERIVHERLGDAIENIAVSSSVINCPDSLGAWIQTACDTFQWSDEQTTLRVERERVYSCTQQTQTVE